MSFVLILPAYLAWHYGEALSDIFRLWTNYLWFFYNFFSVPVLVKTLFSPWQRINESRRKEGFSAEDFASAAAVNLVMRLVGACIRLIFIAIGLFVIIIVFWAGLFIFIVWVLLPLLLISSFFYGLIRPAFLFK